RSGRYLLRCCHTYGSGSAWSAGGNAYWRLRAQGSFVEGRASCRSALDLFDYHDRHDPGWRSYSWSCNHNSWHFSRTRQRYTGYGPTRLDGDHLDHVAIAVFGNVYGRRSNYSYHGAVAL